MFWNICKLHKSLLLTFTILAVVPMSISLSKKTYEHISESWGSTDIKISKLKFTWVINNLKICCNKLKDFVMSPMFSSNNGSCKWYLTIYPKGNTAELKDGVALYLHSENCNATTMVKFSILNGKGEQTNIKEFSHQYRPRTSLGYKSYIAQAYLFDPKNDLLPDNKLTITCEMTIPVGRENSLQKFVEPKHHLVEDFRNLLENKVWTDVILSAGGKEFKAHKAILAAQSPVFKVRFQDDTENRNDTVVEVPDVEPKVLSEILRYIYTEEVHNLEKMAPKLLAAAEIFELDQLKALCENTLRSNLAIENAVDFLILSDKYRAVELKKDAKIFIAVHASDIANTTGFKSLILTQPQLTAELVNSLFQ